VNILIADSAAVLRGSDERGKRRAAARRPLLLFGDDRKKQVRGVLRVPIDLMQRRAAADDMVGNVFGIGRPADAGGHVGTRDLEADAVAAPK
jgi:hypothetical protein